jgi:predicted nuclease of restriction endonuclease-like RecB superfamily
MKQYIEYVKYIEQELKETHYNKIMIANLFACSLIELRKISDKLNIKIDDLTIKNIVDYIKIIE